MSNEIDDIELRRLFDLFTDRGIDFSGILLSLDMLQKQYPHDLQKVVTDLVTAIELRDAGLFPSDWWPPDES